MSTSWCKEGFRSHSAHWVFWGPPSTALFPLNDSLPYLSFLDRIKRMKEIPFFGGGGQIQVIHCGFPLGSVECNCISNIFAEDDRYQKDWKTTRRVKLTSLQPCFFSVKMSSKATYWICAEFSIFAENRYLAKCIWEISSGITWNQCFK